MSNARDKANIPALNFSSTGIDDNATSTAITIDSSERVGIGTASPTSPLMVQSNETSPIIVKGANTKEIHVETTDGETGLSLIKLKNSVHQYNIENGRRANTLTFYAGTGGERMCINSSGNVGIGTSSPSSKLEVSGKITIDSNSPVSGSGLTLGDYSGAGYKWIQSFDSQPLSINPLGNNVGIGTSSPSSLLHIYSSSPQMIIQDGGTHGTNSSPGLVFKDNSSSQGEIGFENSGEMFIRQLKNADMTFRTNNTERMRIDSSGRLGVNTSAPDTGAMQTNLHDGNSTYGLTLASSNSSGTQYHQRFLRGGTSGAMAGYITSNSATTIAFNNSSDERLKENIQNSGSAIQDIKDIQVRQFDWIDNIDTHRDFGFVAQELVNVVPEAVTQGTDELDDNGKPVRSWGVDYSHIVPRLVKVCQEQQTKIEELEARITALETQP